MSAEERRDYHDLAKNQSGVSDYVRRLREADALICQFPVWSFGPPAMLKGWMDRLLMPGVGFDLSNPNMAIPLLTNLKRIAGITTYGRPWWNALLVGDPPKKIMTRYMPRFTEARKSTIIALHMNVATDERARRSSPRCAPRWRGFDPLPSSSPGLSRRSRSGRHSAHLSGITGTRCCAAAR